MRCCEAAQSTDQALPGQRSLTWSLMGLQGRAQACGRGWSLGRAERLWRVQEEEGTGPWAALSSPRAVQPGCRLPEATVENMKQQRTKSPALAAPDLCVGTKGFTEYRWGN